jgi:peptidoglycan hydrolase-like protein with peptidoglycan-binding domain
VSPRRRLLALAAILLVAAVAAAIVLAQPGGHTANAARSSVPPGFTTATVERRTLTERSTVDGTLGYAGAAEVYDRIGGTFTWLPAVGAVIARGGTLFKVDNLPILLMYGPVPAYRALQEGVADGPDVGELNANLIALGFDPEGAIVAGDHFSGATAAAVRRWQHAEGLDETGEVELGRIVFAPGARRITTVHVAIGQDPPGGGSEPQGSEAAGDSSGSHEPSGAGASRGSHPSGPSKGSGPSRGGEPSKRRKPPASKVPPAGGGSSNPSASSKSKEAERPAESSPSKASEAPASHGDEGSPSGKGGSGAGAPELVLSTTAEEQVVTLALKATQQELAHAGESVPVALPDGRTVRGHVSQVGTVASESNEAEKGGEKSGPGGGSGGNGENATIAVTVTLDRPIAHLDKAPVSVELVKAIRRGVLAVPATALLATGGGGFAVQALEGDHRFEIAVTPGMFADGYVQIEGNGLREGMTVLEPQ